MLISVDEALKRILENTQELFSETVSLTQAVDRVTAEDVFAREDFPGFANSAMDGFAVKVKDLERASKTNPVSLRLKEIIRAGQSTQTELKEGEAIKIMTGAPLPPAAEAVVMREHAEEVLSNGHVRIFRKVVPGENVRPRGEDVRSGQLLIKNGTLVRPCEIALLAAQGITSISVISKPRIAIIATGDELVSPEVQSLGPGQIRNSNTPAMTAALVRWGATVLDTGIVLDDPENLKKAIEASLGQADILIVSGGVSVGDFDHTKAVLEGLGIETIFWRVAIKPGKPLLFGLLKERLVFGVPGNPVSTLVCLEEFVRPTIEKMQGHKIKHPSWHLFGTVDEDQGIRDLERAHYLFSQAYEQDGEFYLHVIRPQGSAMVGMACQANALARVSAGTKKVQKGEELPFRWLK